MFKSWTVLVSGVIGLSGVVYAQNWQKSLERIGVVARPYCDAKVAGACEAIGFSQRLRLGLSGAWARSERQRIQPLPREYAENLDVLATGLEAIAQKAGTNREPAKNLVDALAFVAKDLQAKYVDCQTFGMGRLVPVSLRTVRGENSTVAPGWEVLYKCTLSTGEAGGEIQAPGITETLVQLPPAAICLFRARKAAQETPVAGPIAIFGQAKVTVDIRVP